MEGVFNSVLYYIIFTQEAENQKQKLSPGLRTESKCVCHVSDLFSHPLLLPWQRPKAPSYCLASLCSIPRSTCLLWGHYWPFYLCLTPIEKGWVCTYTEVECVYGFLVGGERWKERQANVALWVCFNRFPAGKCNQKLGMGFAQSPCKHFQSTVWN